MSIEDLGKAIESEGWEWMCGNIHGQPRAGILLRPRSPDLPIWRNGPSEAEALQSLYTELIGSKEAA